MQYEVDHKEDIITFNSVGVRYRNGPEIIKDLSMNIESGSFYFLSGQSGSGKTSFLKLIYCINLPVRGVFQIFNTYINNRTNSNIITSIRKKIGMILQDHNLLDYMSVYDNIALPLRIEGRSESSIKSDVEELLDWIGLSNLTTSSVLILSEGQKKRVAIARAIIKRPKILIADEPTANIDENNTEKLMKLFTELNKMGVTIIMSTHDNNIINKYNHPVIKINNGNILKQAL